MGSLNNWFIGLCWIVAAYFAAAFCTSVDFPPRSVTDNGNWLLLIMFLIFFILPFAKKLEIFQFLTFEGKLDKVKEDVKDAQEQIRHIQTLQATLSNSVINNFYSGLYQEEKKDAQTGVNSVSQQAKDKSVAFSDFSSDKPPIESLLMLKANIEKELRKLLKKQLDYLTNRKPTKYISFRTLSDAFIRDYPQYAELSPSFSYFSNVANAAGHGQNIPEEEAREAVRIGTKLYAQIVLMNEGETDVDYVGQ